PALGEGKPQLTLKEAWIDTSMGDNRNFLWGIAVNHPDETFNDKKTHTSYIVAVRGNVVETKRAVYNILSWDAAKIHPQGELF
ncbi:MAG: hypothetical protein RSH52_36465, partial [Janthinobacterium sp.]